MEMETNKGKMEKLKQKLDGKNRIDCKENVRKIVMVNGDTKQEIKIIKKQKQLAMKEMKFPTNRCK